MKLHEKLARAKREVESITRHNDEPVAVRQAAIDALKAHLDAEMDVARAAEAKRAREAAGLPPEEPPKE